MLLLCKLVWLSRLFISHWSQRTTNTLKSAADGYDVCNVASMHIVLAQENMATCPTRLDAFFEYSYGGGAVERQMDGIPCFPFDIKPNNET